MDIKDMTKEQKWAELGRQYVMLEQTQNNIGLLKQALSKQDKEEQHDD